MEFMSEGVLKEQLDKVEFFSGKRAKFYAAETTLRQHGILHWDLKLESELFADHIRALTESFDSRLADVGNP